MTASVLQDRPQALLTAASLNTKVGQNFISAATIGSYIEAWVTCTGNNTPTSVVDSAAQSYTLLTSQYDATNNQILLLYGFANNQSNTTLAVTANWSIGVTNRGVWTREIGGVTTNPVQGSTGAPVGRQQAAPGTGNNAIANTAMTPTSQPCFVSAMTAEFVAAPGAVTTFGTGYTQDSSGFNFGGSSCARAEHIRLTSLASHTTTFTNATDGGTNRFTTISVIYNENTATTPTGAIVSDINLLLSPLILSDPFAPTVNITASGSNQTLALASTISPVQGAPNQVQIYNASTITVFVAFGPTAAKAVATTTNSYPVPAGFLATISPPYGTTTIGIIASGAAGAPTYFTTCNGR